MGHTIFTFGFNLLGGREGLISYPKDYHPFLVGIIKMTQFPQKMYKASMINGITLTKIGYWESS